jgi:hypothetical protein
MKKEWIFVIIFSVLFITFMIGGVIFSYVVDQDNLNQNFLENNGNVVSQERSIEGFDSIVLDGVGDIKVHPGEDYKVVVTTDSNLHEKVITKVESNTLYIDQKGNFNIKESVNLKNLTIDVYIPELKKVSLNGAGNIEIYNGSASELEVSLSGIGNIDAKNYQVENANVILSGTGDMTIWATQTLKGELSGTGNIDALKNSVKTANVILSGTGDISIWVSQTLKGELTGIGNILYKGTPTIKDVNVDGIGSVNRCN